MIIPWTRREVVMTDQSNNSTNKHKHTEVNKYYRTMFDKYTSFVHIGSVCDDRANAAQITLSARQHTMRITCAALR
jgi:hypothetical protein